MKPIISLYARGHCSKRVPEATGMDCYWLQPQRGRDNAYSLLGKKRKDSEEGGTMGGSYSKATRTKLHAHYQTSAVTRKHLNLRRTLFLSIDSFQLEVKCIFILGLRVNPIEL